MGAASLGPRAELAIAAVAFVITVYAAVAFVLTGALDMAGLAVFCAVGLFKAVIAFSEALAMQRLTRRDQRAEKVEG